MVRALLPLLALLLSCDDLTPPRVQSEQTPTPPELVAIPHQPSFQERLVRIAVSDIGVREHGENSGPEVKTYLASVGLPEGHKWCGAWMHDVFRRAGHVLEPARSFALAATWSKKYVVIRKGELERFEESNVSGLERISEGGDAFTLHYNTLKRVGHVGMVIGEDDDYFITVEGNTGPGGERDGQGVHKRMRDKEMIWTLNRWANEAEPPIDPGSGHDHNRGVVRW